MTLFWRRNKSSYSLFWSCRLWQWCLIQCKSCLIRQEHVVEFNFTNLVFSIKFFIQSKLNQVLFDLTLNNYRGTNPADVYLLKVNNRNTRTRCEISSKLTIKTPERRQWLFYEIKKFLTCASDDTFWGVIFM